MSSEEIKEILSSEMKDYVVGSKSCRFDGQNYIMESKFGKLSLDFSNLDYDKITLHAKRCSGNGKFIVKSDQDETEYSVSSKISQSIDLRCVGKFDIVRDGALGELCILGFTIGSKESVESELSNNWKILLKKCESYSGIRLVGDKLLANENACIVSQNIQEIDTNPSGVWTREEGRVKFLSACEITKLVLEGSPPVRQPIQMYLHREMPAPVIFREHLQPVENRPSIVPGLQFQPEEIVKEAVYLYDSNLNRSLSKLNIGYSKIVKHHFSSGKDYISIAKNGIINIPISILQSNQEYVFVFNAKKLSGNGRVKVGLTNTNNPPTHIETIAVSSAEMEKYVILHTGFAPSDQSYKLYISMAGEETQGEILLSRIRITNSTNIHQVKLGIDSQKSGLANAMKHARSLSINYGSAVSDISDNVAKNALKYAQPVGNLFASDTNLSIRGNLAATSFSDLSWFNKVRSILPNVCLFKAKEDIGHNDVVSLGQAGSLIPARKIWIDAFKNLSDSDLGILKKSKTVISPSLSNVQYLVNKLPGVEVLHHGRPFGYLQPREIKFLSNKDYILGIHRHERATQKLIEAWTPEMPPLVMVGLRGRHPDHVICINEYLDYDKLLFLVSNAKLMVDLPLHIDYKSSFLHLAMQTQVPIVSTNWYALDSKYSQFLPATERNEEMTMPSGTALRDGIFSGLQMRPDKVKLNADFNQHLYQFMTLLTG